MLVSDNLCGRLIYSQQIFLPSSITIAWSVPSCGQHNMGRTDSVPILSLYIKTLYISACSSDLSDLPKRSTHMCVHMGQVSLAHLRTYEQNKCLLLPLLSWGWVLLSKS